MSDTEIYSSEHIVITRRDDGFYIESFKKGMGIDKFNKIMGEHPEIKVTSFFAIKDALISAPKSPTLFGNAKERLLIEVSGDETKAFLTLSVNEEEFVGDRKIRLMRDIINRLKELGIVFGIKHDVLMNQLCNNTPLFIAEGIPPENGIDSVIKMYELKDVKPEAKLDGNVDHYELNLINKVAASEWLGEREDPTPGKTGKSIKGEVLFAQPGKLYPLVYDRKTVKEVHEPGKTILYSLRTGAVHFDGDKISVSNFLEIPGNVDFKTGNIDFDGFLTVKGSIEDNFSVCADKDIEILGDYGIGSVKEITSLKGNIYIKGGVAGKNKAIIKSKKNIYTKFVSDATIICEGSVHIGFYCLNSNIIAKEVILDSSKGQIIGGNIQADIKVVTSLLGNASEKQTIVSVKGFDRQRMKIDLETLHEKLLQTKNALAECKQEIAIYSITDNLNVEQAKQYELIKDKFYAIRDELKNLEDDRKTLMGYLKTHGEGEISILKKAFPGSALEIKKIFKEIDKIIHSTSFYFQDGEMKEL